MKAKTNKIIEQLKQQVINEYRMKFLNYTNNLLLLRRKQLVNYLNYVQ